MKQKWVYDKVGSVSYNVAGAFEAMIINLGIVDYGDQWGIEELEAYTIKLEVLKEYNGKKEEG